MKALYNKIGILVLAALAFTACADFDPVPDPSKTLPTLENAHIASLTELMGTFPGNGMYNAYDSIGQFMNPDSTYSDYYIFVQVLGNDISGNLYKSLYVRDISVPNGRAVNITTDKTGLYNYYPTGQKMYIKCTGLCIGDYGGLPQIGYRYKDDNGQWKLGRIPDQMFTDHVIKYGPAPSNPDSLPQPIEINDLSELDAPRMYSQLVLLHNVRFMPGDVGQQFAPAPPVGSNPTSVDRLFTVNGQGSGLTLRTSTACRFFSTPVPAGEGDMVCIYTIYNSTKQFYLRELSDLDLGQFAATADLDRPVYRQSFNNGLADFTAVNVKGSAVWEAASYGSGCVMVQASDGDNNNEDWLYSPAIQLPDTMNRIEATFDEAIGYISNAGYEYLTFLITEEKEGVDPMEADWETLNIPNRHPSSGWNFINVGRMDISKYKGKTVRVAFKFTNGTGRLTWELNNLQIIANKE